MNFSHIENLTDDTGIMQHDLLTRKGYRLDDNARALLLSVLACKHTRNDRSQLRLLHVYLSFIYYMQTDLGEFKNYMNYRKEIAEECGSEDSFGKTIMALGFLMNEGPSNVFSKTAAGIISRAYHRIDKLICIHGIANAVIGICQCIKYKNPDDIKRDLVIKLSDKIVNMYRANSSGNWHWFEPVLTYDNAILPLALLNAYEITGNKYCLTTAFDAMEFLESKVFHDGVLSLTSDNGWYKQEKTTCSKFDQQGINAMAMILYYQQAFRITRNEVYLSRMYISYQWFLGKNDLDLPLYDFSTGGCADGLNIKEINLNQDAASTLAYWISHMIVASELQA